MACLQRGYRTACSNCKRRKERCDGARPYGRCIERFVQPQCRYDEVYRKTDRRGSRPIRAPESGSEASASDLWIRPDASLELEADLDLTSAPVAGDRLPSVSAARVPPEPLGKQQQQPPPPRPSGSSQQLSPDGRGNFIFFGKSADLSLLRNVRSLAGDVLGPCPFVDRPLEPRHAREIMTARPKPSSATAIT